jgi:hypothetical protein
MAVSAKKRREQVKKIIDALGGNGELARELDVVPSAVSNWRRAGRFPATTYLEMSFLIKSLKSPIEAPPYLWGQKARKEKIPSS